MKRKWVEDSEEDVSDTESATSSKKEEPSDSDIDEMHTQGEGSKFTSQHGCF